VLYLFHTYLQEQLDRAPRLSDFTLSAVQRWALALQQRPKWERGGLAVGDKPVALETRRTYLRTLRTFSNWLPKLPHTFCAEPPLQHLLMPRASETYKLPLTEEELAKLLAAAKEDSFFGACDTAMLLFLMDSATRASELTDLRVGDVTLQTGLLLVSRGKGSHSRTVTVGEETRQALRRYALVRDSRPGAVRSSEAPFFQTKQGTPFTYYGLRSWLQRIGERAGVPRVHLHLFRHTSAVETLDVGADLRTVQLKLGHADISTTQRYLHMASERLSERQRQFSPVDHLGLGTPKQPKEKAPIPLWRREKSGQKPEQANVPSHPTKRQQPNAQTRAQKRQQ
jgi:site-specific recombinase XerD